MKRFYKQAAAVPLEGGFGIELDGRAIKTPAKHKLIVSSRALAEAIAQEWQSQGETVEPKAMGLTQLANTCADRVTPRRSDVIAEVARYSETDLLCYRAGDEAKLKDQQIALWTPIIDWFEGRSDIKLAVTDGIMPVPQSDRLIPYVSAEFAHLSDAELTGAHELTSGFGSAVLTLALLAGEINFDAAWQLSILDHNFQVEKWGSDAEAEASLSVKRDAAALGWQFISLSRAG